MKMLKIQANDVKLIEDTDEINEAFASISRNPNVTLVKFILTDDKPNGNKDRIPKEEFANIIRTGLFMPVKMANNEISQGHDGTYPLGSIAQLAEIEDRVEGIAALWDRERKQDVDYLKERYSSGKSIDISWEITYQDYVVDDDVKSYQGVSLNAATVVGIPAYQGRTPVTAIAEQRKNNMDTIDKATHEEIVDALKSERDTLKTEKEVLAEELNTIKDEQADYEDLKKFKTKYDAEQERLAKVETLKTKFEEAGLEVGLEDETKVNTLLEMSENALDFYIQDLLAFASQETDEAEAGLRRKTITSTAPAVSKKNKKVDLVEHLRKLDNKSGGK